MAKINELICKDKINELKDFCDEQYTKLYGENGDENEIFNTISFECSETGSSIIDPFYDSTYRFSVDPIEEYGLDFLNSDFMKLNFLNIDNSKLEELKNKIK